MNQYYPPFNCEKNECPSNAYSSNCFHSDEDALVEDFLSLMSSQNSIPMPDQESVFEEKWDLPTTHHHHHHGCNQGPVCSRETIVNTASVGKSFLAEPIKAKLAMADGEEIEVPVAVESSAVNGDQSSSQLTMTAWDDLSLTSLPELKIGKRMHHKYEVPSPDRIYYRPSDCDVCLGRGGWTNKHPGNRQFHEWKRELMHEYFAIARKQDRTPVSKALMKRVHENGGRFLQRDDKGWYEARPHKARNKCAQALRDGKITKTDRRFKRQWYMKKNRDALPALLDHPVEFIN